MVSALVLLFSSVVAAVTPEQGFHGLQLAANQQAYKLQIERVLAVNSDLEARVTALETQMAALQSEMTAQQTEVVAVQKEVAAVDDHLVQVDDALTNLTVSYNATVGLVDIMESSITTTITRVNQTEVRVSLVEEGVVKVNSTAKNNSASLLELAMAFTKMNKDLASTTTLANETAIGLDLVNSTLSNVATELHNVNSTVDANSKGLSELTKVMSTTKKELALTTGMANETAMGLDMVNATVGLTKKIVVMHGGAIATAREAIKKINDKDLPDVKENVSENHEMVKKNEEKLGSHENSIKRNEKELEQDASLISDNKVAIVDNSKGIEQAERGINGLGKAVNVVSRKVKANRKTSSDNVESIKDINKEMTYVKTQVVEFCGYQSSWGKEEKAVTYEYLTVSKNTASESSSESLAGLGHPPTPRPTGAPHHQLPGLNTKSGLFVAPMAGTYRVSFQVGHLETGDTDGEHKTSIFVRKNGLKEETLHMETKSHSAETNVIAHEALVKMSKKDTLDVFVDETKDDLYGILFCIALV